MGPHGYGKPQRSGDSFGASDGENLISILVVAAPHLSQPDPIPGIQTWDTMDET